MSKKKFDKLFKNKKIELTGELKTKEFTVDDDGFLHIEGFS